MSNLKKYNRFLITDEAIPRRTLYRRRLQGNCAIVSEAVPEISSELINSDNRDEFNFNMLEDKASSPLEKEDSELKGHENDFDSADIESKKRENDFDVENPSSPLYHSADITNFEAFLCILAFCVRFHLSGVCIEELLRLLKILLPACTIPGSKYLLNKKIKSSMDYENFYKVHLYCSNCNEYLSEVEESKIEIICSACEEKKLASELLLKGNFFIQVPLEDQIRKKLERQTLFIDVQNYHARCAKESLYKDVICGDSYSVSEMTNNLSLQFNVDGIPMYNKAKYDLWPIHCMINELPPAKRKENIMMCGLWFGPKKPSFKTYLKPFIDELDILCKKGLSWQNNGKTVSTKVIPVLCTADAPARAMLQNFNQYNGKYGCEFCENEGKRIERGRGYSRIYKILYPPPANRTFSKSIEYAEIAVNRDRPVKGIKGSSLLMQLYPHFDMVEGFVPDYMHCVLLGVTRQFVNLWLSTSDEVYSLKKNQIAELNKRICNIREPSEMTRKLRSLSDVVHWKASEWRIFLLMSPVLLLNIIHLTVYQHWILIVHGITLLLGSDISSKDLELAESALKKFVKGVDKIYGEGELTYNVHLLSHLPDKVKSWGPLWASSCFSYEDALGKLKKFHQGTKGVPMQILFAYFKKSLVQTLLQQNINNVRATKFIEDMNNGKRATKKTLRIKNIILFGSGKIEMLSKFHKETVENIVNTSLNKSTVLTFKRALHKNILFSTKEYSEQFNRVDSIVSVYLSKIHLVEIVKIIVYNENIIFLGTKLKTKKFFKNDVEVGDLCSNILCIKEAKYNNKSIIAFSAESIVQKYATIKLEADFYLVPLLFHAEE